MDTHIHIHIHLHKDVNVDVIAEADTEKRERNAEMNARILFFLLSGYDDMMIRYQDNINVIIFVLCGMLVYYVNIIYNAW